MPYIRSFTNYTGTVSDAVNKRKAAGATTDNSANLNDPQVLIHKLLGNYVQGLDVFEAKIASSRI